MATNNPPAVEFKSAPPPQVAQLEPLPPSPRPPTSLQNPESCINSIFKPPQRGEDYTILQAVFSIDMLVLFISASCGIDSTLTAINNLGQIGKSLSYPNTSISTFVSLMSIWNYLGRVVSGFSEFLLTKFCLSRPLLLTVVLLISCLSHLLIAFGIPNSLYFASVIIGFCFSAQWPLLFAIVSDIFGLKCYSTLFQFGAVASPVGAYLLNVKVAGRLYDKEALKQLGAKGLERQLGQDVLV
ncbi:putative transporter MCH1 [Camellia lanceoleosa]|uniref:Transporter MCH1 n=1 Tax=Camellia lanceoleosa TaxID=1840588 RepID=A0ACC0HTD9_9ERIC|nr:putative transporter MCH1 [Camellia lanceoleosa]